MKNLPRYSKAIAAFAAFLGVLGAAMADGSFSTGEIGALISAGGGVVAVFGVENREPGDLDEEPSGA